MAEGKRFGRKPKMMKQHARKALKRVTEKFDGVHVPGRWSAPQELDGRSRRIGSVRAILMV
jgi:hypothetical protein